ncbi:MAG: rhodanese-related sulfurtransferase, partial [Neolewinella sp.]
MTTLTPQALCTDPAWQGFALIDVRSPGEYEEACLPGALNLPL